MEKEGAFEEEMLEFGEKRLVEKKKGGGGGGGVGRNLWGYGEKKVVFGDTQLPRTESHTWAGCEAQDFALSSKPGALHSCKRGDRGWGAACSLRLGRWPDGGWQVLLGDGVAGREGGSRQGGRGRAG